MKLQIETNIVKVKADQNLALTNNVITSSSFIEIFNKSRFFYTRKP